MGWVDWKRGNDEGSFLTSKSCVSLMLCVSDWGYLVKSDTVRSLGAVMGWLDWIIGSKLGLG